MSFNDFLHKYGFKNEATSKTKFRNILFSVALSDVGIFRTDDFFNTDIGIVNLHPEKEHIGLYTSTKITSIEMRVPHQETSELYKK